MKSSYSWKKMAHVQKWAFEPSENGFQPVGNVRNDILSADGHLLTSPDYRAVLKSEIHSGRIFKIVIFKDQKYLCLKYNRVMTGRIRPTTSLLKLSTHPTI